MSEQSEMERGKEEATTDGDKEGERERDRDRERKREKVFRVGVHLIYCL